MGLFDLFGSRKESPLTLDAASLEKWPERLLRRKEIPQRMATHIRDVERQRRRLQEAAERLIDPLVRDRRVPERARPVFDEHAPIVAAAARGLAGKGQLINDVFLVEAQQQDFQEAIAEYREATGKSVPALREFLNEELFRLEEGVQGLEDAMLAITPSLDQSGFSAIRQVKLLIEEYKGSRKRERQLLTLRERLMAELDGWEAKRRRHKEKINYYTERSRDSKFKELIAEEEELLDRVDAIKVRCLPSEEEERELRPLNQRLAFLRKQMINDITAMNINEQRTFLEATKDEIRLAKRKLERVDDLLAELSFDAYRNRFLQLLEPFNVRIEDIDTIIDPEEADVAPQ